MRQHWPENRTENHTATSCASVAGQPDTKRTQFLCVATRARSVEIARPPAPPGLPPDPFADDPTPSAWSDRAWPAPPDQQERDGRRGRHTIWPYTKLCWRTRVRGLVVCCDECRLEPTITTGTCCVQSVTLLIDGTVTRTSRPTSRIRTRHLGFLPGYADTSLRQRQRQTRTGSAAAIALAGASDFHRAFPVSAAPVRRLVGRFQPGVQLSPGSRVLTDGVRGWLPPWTWSSAWGSRDAWAPTVQLPMQARGVGGSTTGASQVTVSTERPEPQGWTASRGPQRGVSGRASLHHWCPGSPR